MDIFKYDPDIQVSQETPLCQEDAEVLANIYQQITSKLYSGESDQEIMRDLNAVKIFLGTESQLYNFEGMIAKIHSSITIEEFTEFPAPVLVAYIELMHYDIDEDILEKGIRLEIATMLQQHQLARLENLRIHKYINNVLFLPVHQKPAEFPGILYWHDIPSFSNIISRGALYFYPRIGELTIDLLVSMFDFQELVHLAMMFGVVRVGRNKRMNRNKNDIIFRLETGTTIERIARAVMLMVENAEFDPRVLLTPQGFKNLYIQEESENSMSINSRAPFLNDDLYIACSQEGIPLFDSVTDERKPDDILFEEYTIIQFSPAFSSHIGEHRSPYEALRRVRTPSGSRLWDLAFGEMVFFGKRDGLSKVDGYTLTELIFVFKQNRDFFDPESIRLFPKHRLMWITFSRIAIKRLLTKILPKMERSNSSGNAKELSEVIRKILNRPDDTDLSKATIRKQRLLINAIKEEIGGVGEDLEDISATNDREAMKMVLIRIFDVGTLFFRIDDLIEHYDPELLSEMMMRDPYNSPPQPYWTGRVRAELRDLMMRIYVKMAELSKGTRALFDRLRVFRIWDDTLYVNYDDDPYTIEGYLEIIFDMIQMGLFKQLRTSGRHLMATASEYHKIFYGLSFTDIRLEFGEINTIADGDLL